MQRNDDQAYQTQTICEKIGVYVNIMTHTELLRGQELLHRTA